MCDIKTCYFVLLIFSYYVLVVLFLLCLYFLRNISMNPSLLYTCILCWDRYSIFYSCLSFFVDILILHMLHIKLNGFNFILCLVFIVLYLLMFSGWQFNIVYVTYQNRNKVSIFSLLLLFMFLQVYAFYQEVVINPCCFIIFYEESQLWTT